MTFKVKQVYWYIASELKARCTQYGKNGKIFFFFFFFFFFLIASEF